MCNDNKEFEFNNFKQFFCLIQSGHSGVAFKKLCQKVMSKISKVSKKKGSLGSWNKKTKVTRKHVSSKSMIAICLKKIKSLQGVKETILNDMYLVQTENGELKDEIERLKDENETLKKKLEFINNITSYNG